MRHQNCTVLDILLLYLLLETIGPADSRNVERTKRLTTPIRDNNTIELAKYVVSIRSSSPQIIFGDNHFCVGAIIAPQFVLTVARCAFSGHKVKHRTQSLVIVAGTPNRLISVSETVTMKLEKILVPKDLKNNIALMKVMGKWPTNNPSIGIVRLPVSEPSYEIDYLVLGWGRMYKGGPIAGNLAHIIVKLIDFETCQKIIKNMRHGVLCAGNFGNETDSSPCAGDTGAPMISSNHTLVGLVSYRMGCGVKDMPSIYTDVWHHMDWINNTLRGGCPPASKPCIILFLCLYFKSIYRYM